jgi:hypothetical protein
VTTMTAYQRPEIGEIRVKDGVEYIFEECGRCGGTGYVVFMHVDGGVCFDCRATHQGRLIGRGGFWVNKADFDRRAKRREADAKRREAKAAAVAAELPGKLAATLQAQPILAELLKLEDYSGLLGSFRSQLEKKGILSDKQIALAKKIVIENAERAAHAENERRSRVDAPIGEIGERREFTGKVVFVDHRLDTFKPYEAYKTFMIVVTDEGTIKWQASKYISVERGEQITIKATVKSHDADKQDRIVTIVTRGQIIN